MTDQRTERKIDFFELEVAENEEKQDILKRIEMIDIGDGLDPSFMRSPSITMAIMDEAMRKVEKVAQRMQNLIDVSGLDARPVVYSRPSSEWPGLDLAVGIQPRENPDMNRYRANINFPYSDGFMDGIQEWAALCTPSRNPITGS